MKFNILKQVPAGLGLITIAHK